jgi:hypothetical protein
MEIAAALPWEFNPLNAKLNPICQLLALLGAHHILHVSRLRVKQSRKVILYRCFGATYRIYFKGKTFQEFGTELPFYSAQNPQKNLNLKI